MSERSRVSQCSICGAGITLDAALGVWTDGLGRLFCRRPFTGPRTAIPRSKADAARFPPAGVGTPDGPTADAAGSARRLQALIAIGHCETRLASLLRRYGGLESEGDVARLVTPPGGARVTVSRGTHDAICRLYDDLWDQPPPEHNPAERAAAAAARALARQRDWPTPAALDDDLIDDPAYQPQGGWLPATLAGVPQRPVPAPPAAPPALITPCRAPAAGRPGPSRVTAPQRRCAPPPKPSSADRGCPMAPLPHDQDITSWLQLLSAIEDAEAGRGTARLTEICLSVYGALAAAQFQITQLRARVHVLATSGPARTVIP